MAKQEDIFKNVISHAKSTVYFSKKYTMVSAVYDYAQNGVELKEHTRILVEINGSNER
jgi:glycyl-tRNA synthetase